MPCRGCGGALEAAAKFCARCGRSRDLLDATTIELRPLGASTSAQQTAIVATRPPDRKRTLTALGAVAVVALVAFGLVKTFDDAADEATSPTSTMLASTTIPTSTSAPPTTAPVTTMLPTTAAPRVTSAPTTSSIPYVNQRPGAVLDVAQAGRSIYVANVQDLWRIELDTGRVTSRQISSTFNGFDLLGVVDGRVVLYAPQLEQRLSWVRTDLAGDITPIDMGGLSLVNHTPVAADGIWLIRWSGSTAPTVVRRIDLSGEVRAEIVLPGGIYPTGMLGDRAVITQFGRIWTVGTDGKPVPYATGTVVAVQASSVLWVGCDDTARCTFRLGNATDSDTKRTSLETSYLGAWKGDAMFAANILAPDGATIVGEVLAPGSPPRPKIVDLATGSALELSGRGAGRIAWTPGGEWLLEIALVGEGVATNVRTGNQVVLHYPLAFTGRNGSYVGSMAVG